MNKAISTYCLFSIIFTINISAQTFQNEILGSEEWNIHDAIATNGNNIVMAIGANNRLMLSEINGDGVHLRSEEILITGTEGLLLGDIKIDLFGDGSILIYVEMGVNRYILKLDTSWEVLFLKEISPKVFSLESLPNGDFILFGGYDGEVHFMRFDALGENTISRSISTSTAQPIVGTLVSEFKDNQLIVNFTENNIAIGETSHFFSMDLNGNIIGGITYMDNKFSPIDINLDSGGNIILYSILGILKFDPQFNLLWIKGIVADVNLINQEVDKMYVDTDDNIVVRTLGVRSTQNPTLGIVTTKVDPDGETIFSKLLLDNVHTTSNSFMNLDTAMVSFSKNINGFQTIRKLDSQAEASDCLSFDYCMLEFSLELVFEPLSLTTEAETVINLTNVTYDKLSRDLTLRHICAPVELPDASFEVVQDSLCLSELVNISYETIYPFGDSQWRIYDDSGILSASAGGKEPIAFDSLEEGDYKLVHQLTIGNCSYADSIPIHIFPVLPVQLDTNYSICEDAVLELEIYSEEIVFTEWSDGTSLLSFETQSAGGYSLAYSDINGCDYTESFNVEVEPLPQLEVSQDTQICDGETLILTADTQFYENLIWSDGSNSSNLQVYESGIYIVAVDNQCGSIEKSIIVEVVNCNEKIFIPNIFMPSSSGENSIFSIHAFNVVINDFRVYDRWGSNVYISQEDVINWDGTFDGKKLEVGVYTYVLRYTNSTTFEMRTKHGNLTLLR